MLWFIFLLNSYFTESTTLESEGEERGGEEIAEETEDKLLKSPEEPNDEISFRGDSTLNNAVNPGGLPSHSSPMSESSHGITKE